MYYLFSLLKPTTKLFVIYLPFLVMTNMSCGQSPNSSALPGHYYFNRSNVQDSLIVNTDNSYKHLFYASDGRVFERSGTWAYDSMPSEVRFSDFTFFNNEGPVLPAGVWISRVRVDDKGNINLMYSSENNLYFLKKMSNDRKK